jgi:hypothetical protein
MQRNRADHAVTAQRFERSCAGSNEQREHDGSRDQSNACERCRIDLVRSQCEPRQQGIGSEGDECEKSKTNRPDVHAWITPFRIDAPKICVVDACSSGGEAYHSSTMPSRKVANGF